MRDFCVVIFIVGVGIFSAIMASAATEHSWRDFLVDEGKAEYYLDEMHNKKWRMIE